jgi:SAM-dependent methyltransferase
MPPRLYRELVPWYRLVDPTRDHLDEATSYQAALEGAASPRPETLLELGSGAGNNAFYLKRRFRCTLTDLSEEMLALSRDLNPECEHHLGDMRTLRLGRSFDAVFVHDAIMYLTTEADLRAVADTAFAHTRPGGAAVFAPDCLRETFKEYTSLIAEEDGRRTLRGIEWSWDPDPDDDTSVIDFAFLLRDGAEVRAEYDRHIEGLFPRATWLGVLSAAGYGVESAQASLGDGETGEIFVCRRP